MMRWHKRNGVRVCIYRGFVFTIKKGRIGAKQKPVYWVYVNYKTTIIKEYERFNTLMCAKWFCWRYIRKGTKR